MNMDKLKDMLRPWMANETWHTPHPCDAQRFHKALKSIFDEMGTGIGGDDFQEVMHDLADEYYPAWNQDHKDKLVLSFAMKAESIGSYLFIFGLN
jgi:hypothetical protein